MSDLISRQAVQEAITVSIELKENPHQMWKRIQDLSGAEKTGHWKPIHVTSIGQSVFSCSECEKIISVHIDIGECLYNYCPKCGCRMFEPQESEEV